MNLNFNCCLYSERPGMDRNRFKFQRTNEVSAVFSTTADGEIPESYVTIDHGLLNSRLIISWTFNSNDSNDHARHCATDSRPCSRSVAGV